MRDWLVPCPEDLMSERALFHLGLNKAGRFYRELVVPGIGGVWWVRQLSWAIAGIYLHEEMGVTCKPSKIANAVEALAEKSEWKADKENFKGKGKNAFARDTESQHWSFEDLSNKKHYVQVTYRQSTVSALRGLGLTEGTRFNAMELEEIGKDFAENILNTTLSKSLCKNFLLAWINGEKTVGNSNLSVLTKTKVTEEEKKQCLELLKKNTKRGIFIDIYTKHSQTQFIDIETIKKELNIAGKIDILHDIETALSFDKMLSKARETIYLCAELIKKKGALYRIEPDIENKLNELYDASAEYLGNIEEYHNSHPDSEIFANAIKENVNSCVIFSNFSGIKVSIFDFK